MEINILKNKYILCAYIFIQIIILSKCEIETAPENLLFVFSHFRHGARTSSKLDKNGKDFFNETYNKDGELVAAGLRMNFLLGMRNKKRYENLLSKTYEPRELFVLTTDVNRTILSAMSQFMGMYETEQLSESVKKLAIPPVFDSHQNSSLLKKGLDILGNYSLPGKFDLIPIHAMDNAYTRFTCKKSKSFKESNYNIVNVTNFTKTFNETYGERLITYFNISDKNYFHNMKTIINLCDQYISSKYEGKENKIKKFEEESHINLTEFEESCNEGIKLKYRYVENGDKENISVKVRSSRIMKDILIYMERKIKDDRNNDTDVSKYSFNDYSRPKMFFLSAHESTVAPMQIFIQIAFNISDYYHIKFSSNVFFELYRNNGPLKGDFSDYYVEYYFDDKLVGNWTYADFRSNILRVAWDEKTIDNFCETPTTDSSKTWIILTIVTILTFILIIYVIVLISIKFSKNKERDVIIDTNISGQRKDSFENAKIIEDNGYIRNI